MLGQCPASSAGDAFLHFSLLSTCWCWNVICCTGETDWKLLSFFCHNDSRYDVVFLFLLKAY